MKAHTYSVSSVVDGLRRSLIEYLEAQYHIWNESLVTERRRLLQAPQVIAQQPYLEATASYRVAPEYALLDLPGPAKAALETCAGVRASGVFPRPYVHQAEALVGFLTNNRQLVVATGTGSGKTECFLLPILGVLACEAVQQPTTAQMSGCRALLLYPMNALVNDQVSRLRRLFGNDEVAAALSAGCGRFFKFGSYTSRTPYPGQRTAKRDREELRPLFEKLFLGIDQDDRRRLLREGKWPSKDVDRFAAEDFQTIDTDRELLTRHEMHRTCPDILVTNYSMLEYMLLRPIEAPIFEQTRSWLHADPRNYLTVVLDEAHMYRGAQGAEVGLLLRRLQSRLQVPRERFRYILTSASLGDSEESKQGVLAFAEALTGAGGNKFELVESVVETPASVAPATQQQTDVLAGLDISAIQGVMDGETLPKAAAELGRIAELLKLPAASDATSEAALREWAYQICQKLPPAGLLLQAVTGKTKSYESVALEVFGNAENSSRALESILALATFGKSGNDDRPFLPARLHLFYRGLAGVFACTNPRCSFRRADHDQPLLGRMYDSPRERCECGSRVYELLTHRDCGAAFLRAYVRDADGDFLWHEPPAHRDPGEPTLVEAHYLVEVGRHRARDGKLEVWLHKESGRLVRKQPERAFEEYVPLVQPPDLLTAVTPPVLSYDGECPVCLKGWNQKKVSRIMDLQTKGDAPFAHLVKTQVRLQPPTVRESVTYPNAGRKSLLFSDGRQKAARLARDIPREIEQDTFRQLLMLAVQNLQALSRDAVPTTTQLYLAFVNAVAAQNVALFDGADAEAIAQHVRLHVTDYRGDLEEHLRDTPDLTPPLRYRERLLRQLGASFYSLFSLNLAYVEPKPFVARKIRDKLSALPPADVDAVAIIWIQNFLDRFAFDANIPDSVRNCAAGWHQSSWGEKSGFRKNQFRFVDKLFGPSAKIQTVFKEELTTEGRDGHFLDPNRLRIVPAFDVEWYQCQACTYLSPVAWRDTCVNCGQPNPVRLQFDASPYLQARKIFWRDPVRQVLDGTTRAFALDVQEHTAQLNYRDTEKVTATTEEFERRFRDILIGKMDRPIDVLSCTTTMEVGVDIGSLVAVGLRNVPPERQNYQQRAGRAGRRGSSVSTVVTYAQNNPHDNHYFINPFRIIAGPPAEPAIDSDNPTIAARHANAQILQAFFYSQAKSHQGSGDIYTVLGPTIEFFHGTGDFSLAALKRWLEQDSEATRCLAQIDAWLPPGFDLAAQELSTELLVKLADISPPEDVSLAAPGNQLLEFLFSNGLLPSYAFPRHLVALQVEELRMGSVKIVERPQQGLAVALSEYAPGRWVVVNKKTYKVGTVAANCSMAEQDRARPLFASAKRYVQCPNCFHTEYIRDLTKEEQCSVCRNGALAQIEILQPEIVFPQGGRAIDELADDQVFTEVTSAQLPYPRQGRSLDFHSVGAKSSVAYGHNEELVMVNRGEDTQNGGSGFLVCEKCGKASLPSAAISVRHDRDYHISKPGSRRVPPQCDGVFRPVYLGYSFLTDILIYRVTLEAPFSAQFDDTKHRRPLADAARSLSEALAQAAAAKLDIDPRELRAGFRFLALRDERVLDIFLYDTLAGGAGYATLAGKQIATIAKDATDRLAACDCDSSCDKCLRSYDNRFAHTALNRFLALDLLAYAQEGKSPQLFTSAEQVTALRPLMQFLELEGWKIDPNANSGTDVTWGATRHSLSAYPALLDPAVVADQSTNRLIFSDYEIRTALPDAAAKVSR